MARITFNRDEIDYAAKTIAEAIGKSVEEIRRYIDTLIERYDLLQSATEEITLIYAEEYPTREVLEFKLKEMSRAIERMMDGIEYVTVNPLEFVAPYVQPPYTKSLHPRKDYQRSDYWLRIRSNPYRRNYH